ncbi:hypothetical protein DY000_02033497 [Brassica cretica]|uniref:Uncharacterized protein n=1 Tax=Brassica cretica TaxID=69181 RepID=A0ABQ7DEY2_BRACR|nr:hypothetical protein DY000_02033497 [Brassica cretica]
MTAACTGLLQCTVNKTKLGIKSCSMKQQKDTSSYQVDEGIYFSQKGSITVWIVWANCSPFTVTKQTKVGAASGVLARLIVTLLNTKCTRKAFIILT